MRANKIRTRTYRLQEVAIYWNDVPSMATRYDIFPPDPRPHPVLGNIARNVRIHWLVLRQSNGSAAAKRLRLYQVMDGAPTGLFSEINAASDTDYFCYWGRHYGLMWGFQTDPCLAGFMSPLDLQEALIWMTLDDVPDKVQEIVAWVGYSQLRLARDVTEGG